MLVKTKSRRSPSGRDGPASKVERESRFRIGQIDREKALNSIDPTRYGVAVQPPFGLRCEPETILREVRRQSLEQLSIGIA